MSQLLAFLTPFFVLKMGAIFILTLILIKLLIAYAPKLGLIDIPNNRSVHKKVTPRGAGIAMIGAMIIADTLFLNNLAITHLWTYIAILLVFSVGVLDDHRDAPPKAKFIIIAIATVLLSFDGLVISSLGSFFGVNLSLGWFALPFTIFAVAGFTNALNLSDGLDGLAGSLSIVILGSLTLIGAINNDLFMVSLALCTISALMAFLIFNWHPAKIFMGDSGSLTLGFIISILSIKALAYIEPIAILFIAAIPILDTIIVMVRRKRNGHSIFAADKFHLHHILLRFFDGNIRKTVLLLALLQCSYSLIGFDFSKEGGHSYTFLLFIGNVLILYLLLNGMLSHQNRFSIHRKKKV